MDPVNYENSQTTTYKNQSLIPIPRIGPFRNLGSKTTSSSITATPTSLDTVTSTVTPNPLSPDTVQLIQQVAQVSHRTELENQQQMRQLRPYIILAVLSISLLILTLLFVLFVKSRSTGGVLPFNRPPIL